MLTRQQAFAKGGIAIDHPLRPNRSELSEHFLKKLNAFALIQVRLVFKIPCRRLGGLIPDIGAHDRLIDCLAHSMVRGSVHTQSLSDSVRESGRCDRLRMFCVG